MIAASSGAGLACSGTNIAVALKFQTDEGSHGKGSSKKLLTPLDEVSRVKKALSNDPSDLPGREQRIRSLAYARFKSRRHDHVGDPIQDWLDAEAEIDAEPPAAVD